jgi:hypothetical protein
MYACLTSNCTACLSCGEIRKHQAVCKIRLLGEFATASYPFSLKWLRDEGLLRLKT